MIISIFGLGDELAAAALSFLRERQLGPDTAASQQILNEIDSLEEKIAQDESELHRLHAERTELRRANATETRNQKRAEKAENPGWWQANRAELLVNVVGGALVSVPIFILGVVVTLLWLQ